MTTKRFLARTAGTAALAMSALLGVTATAEAQLANASASTLALAGNNTATARAFGAISVNPAGLGMPGSGFSLALAPVQVQLGLSPIGTSDLYDYQGVLIPAATREAWLQEIVAAGGETGSVGVDVTELALTMGNMGFQVSTRASMALNIPEGVAEALLFGNAGRTGSPSDIGLNDASVDAFATTTAALSLALPVNDQLTLGVTGKYIMGHALVVADVESGSFTASPLEATMSAPMISSCFDEVVCTQDFVNGGAGIGVDLGAILVLPALTLGATLENIMNSFAWDEAMLAYRPGTLTMVNGSVNTSFTEADYNTAPAALRARIADYGFSPAYRVGAALELTPLITLTGDIHGQMGEDDLSVGPSYHTGVGATMDLGLLQLRAGMSKIEAGMQYGAGAALVLGPVNLSTSGGLLRGDVGDAVLGQFVLSFGHR